MAIISSCPGRSFSAAQQALLFQPAYLTGGKQIRELPQVDLCWSILVEYRERIVTLAVVASRRRHTRGVCCRYGTARHVLRAAQVIGVASFGIAQGLVGEQDLSHPLLGVLAFVDVRMVLQRQVFEGFF